MHFSISSCHGHLLCLSQVLTCPLLHSPIMSFLVIQPVFCLQLYTPYISSPSPCHFSYPMTIPVRYSITLDTRCFRWNMLRLSSPHGSGVSAATYSFSNLVCCKCHCCGQQFLLDLSREEVCLPSFDVVNCPLK